MSAAAGQWSVGGELVRDDPNTAKSGDALKGCEVENQRWVAETRQHYVQLATMVRLMVKKMIERGSQ